MSSSSATASSYGGYSIHFLNANNAIGDVIATQVITSHTIQQRPLSPSSGQKPSNRAPLIVPAIIEAKNRGALVRAMYVPSLPLGATAIEYS